MLDELGRGGMGVVYKARHRKLNCVVALKNVLAGEHASAETLARFQREAEAVAQLSHPNIVRVFEVGAHDGVPYFSLEWCARGSLAKELNGTPLPPAAAAALVRTLALAVHAAHEKGVVHRDLKPANVLLGGQAFQPDSSADVRLESLTSKITDFGLARRIGTDSSLTATGAILGTPSYMAPEQAGGEAKAVGPPADVYALGAILYECLTGRPPFKAATTAETLLQVISAEPVSPRRLNAGVPRDLATICLKCLHKEPQRRYATAAELADDLRRFQGGEPVRARPAGRAERLWRWARRNPAIATLAALLAAIVLGSILTLTQLYLRARANEERARDNEEKVLIALTNQVAERLTSELSQLEKVAQALAALAEDPRHDEGQLERWMRQMLDGDPRLFGLTVAFEPHAFANPSLRASVGGLLGPPPLWATSSAGLLGAPHGLGPLLTAASLFPETGEYCLYVSRKDRGLRVERLDMQPYAYRTLHWYKDPVEKRRARWSASPAFDEGGAEEVVVAYMVPIRRAGRVVGVAAADLSLRHFFGTNLQSRRWLGELDLESSYCFVIGHTQTRWDDWQAGPVQVPLWGGEPGGGVYLSHPAYEFPLRIQDQKDTKDYHDLGKRLLRRTPHGELAESTGKASAWDPHKQTRSTFLFARVPSAEWTVVVVIEEQP